MDIEIVTQPPFAIDLQSVLPPIVVSNVLPWQVVNGSTQMVCNAAYAVDALTFALLGLPQTAQLGDRIIIYAVSGIFRVVQAAGQRCKVNTDLTSEGITGAIVSQSDGDLIELTYIRGLWTSTGIFGNLSII
jgi:hypothetical protein